MYCTYVYHCYHLRIGIGIPSALRTYINYQRTMALAGFCFAITGEVQHSRVLSGVYTHVPGALSVGRSEFEQLITRNGGTVAKSVTKSCTHLIRFDAD